jgi:hypothetical protein
MAIYFVVNEGVSFFNQVGYAGNDFEAELGAAGYEVILKPDPARIV